MVSRFPSGQRAARARRFGLRDHGGPEGDRRRLGFRVAAHSGELRTALEQYIRHARRKFRFTKFGTAEFRLGTSPTAMSPRSPALETYASTQRDALLSPSLLSGLPTGGGQS